ncbi:hypothetical protein ACJ5NV_02410 [Loktanella agnita]|uniref:hypothetical protein n=1 Tax=Loktanella agnita TaxID=287097 RepID=UPI00398790A8
MRDFFIRSLDLLIGLFVILAILGVLLAAFAATSGGMSGPNGAPVGGGPIAGLLVLVLGLLYVCFVAGFMYLGLGIYHNTRRTADAVERMAGK